jgi:pSer/pThr/pTyr-binding forkhead associated (FHA) protein
LDAQPPVNTITVHRPGRPPERRELRAPSRAGGSQADDIHLPDCPPGALSLLPCAAGVVVEAAACGIHAGGRSLGPGARRLLRAGERVDLHGASISVEEPPGDGTRAIAGGLLRAAAGGAAPTAGPHLLVLSGPAAGTRHPLGEEQTLGRGPGATIVIPDPRASRVHARLRVGAEGAAIEDLRSKNGVLVNGVRIERRPQPLRPGDEVGIGATALVLVADPWARNAGGTRRGAARCGASSPRRSSRSPPRRWRSPRASTPAQARPGDSDDRSSSVSKSSRWRANRLVNWTSPRRVNTA